MSDKPSYPTLAIALMAAMTGMTPTQAAKAELFSNKRSQSKHPHTTTKRTVLSTIEHPPSCRCRVTKDKQMVELVMHHCDCGAVRLAHSFNDKKGWIGGWIEKGGITAASNKETK